ncbi:MAG TPA: choice-of-anchor D domain-containing protein [Verrucomicrobiales bacterium]|nr:choice-of-anchor D domain-containing protein [Verrucomicrobiales bacterium]
MLVFLLLTAAGVRVQALTIDGGMDLSYQLSAHFSLEVVDGRPAIAWAAGDFKSVKYSRALDAAGAAWSPHAVIDMGENTGRLLKMIVADGNPAVCYLDATLGKLRYSRALDAQGSVWEDPKVLETGLQAPVALTMESVGGFPAVCFASPAGLQYLRAANAQGSSWGAVQTVDPSAPAGDLSMKVVQGNPAVAYGRKASQGYELIYIRALDGAGAAWGAPLQVAAQPLAQSPPAPYLEVVSGLPTIAWGILAPNYDQINYRRAIDAQGSAWNPWQTPDPFLKSSGRLSLAVIGGKPAIACHDAINSDLLFLHAQETTGEGGSWPAPVRADIVGKTGLHPALRDVNGLPAIAYLNVSRKTLEYVRASAQSPAFRWPAQLRVTTPGVQEPLIPGANHDFRTVTLGKAAVVAFDLFNPNLNADDLKVTSYTLEGPDAAEFTLETTRSPPYTLKPFAWMEGPASVLIRLQPLTPGYKNAVLRIEHDGNPSPFTIAFTADVNPHLLLSPLGLQFSDGYHLDLLPTHPGSPQEFVFNVHNSGGAELNRFAVTFDGPDAGEFSVSVPPPPAIPPDGTATFSVHHATSTIGVRTATLRVASNAVGTIPQTTLRLIAGAQDTSFAPHDEWVESLAVQPDGKILTGGFSLRRLLPDGMPDPAFFSPVVKTTTAYNCMAVQRDGRILTGGVSPQVNGQPQRYLTRFHPDGTLDDSFAPAIDIEVYCIAIQPDGKILFGGGHRGEPQGDPPPVLARLNEDGSVDPSFVSGMTSGWVDQIVVQPDRKILVSREFPAGENPPRLVRLDPGGGLDTVFSTQSSNFALLPDGRVLVSIYGKLERFLPNGTADPMALPQPNSPIGNFAVQADGACVLAGFFDKVDGQFLRNVARLRSDGTLDTGFEFQFNTLARDSDAHRLAQLPGGGLLLGGNRPFQADPNSGFLFRLGNDPAVSLVERDTASNTVRWRLDGTAPAVTDASFEFKPMGASEWMPLGFGVPAAGGWELHLSGPPLSAHGTLRARGRSGGSLYEAVAWFLPPLETWRLAHFHTPDATGDAANDADPDKDGLTNLAEFAFGLSPVDSRDRRVPMFELTPAIDGHAPALTATFPSLPGREILHYAAEQSATLLPGTWTSIPDTGNGNEHTFRTGADNPLPGTGRIFVRFAISLRGD